MLDQQRTALTVYNLPRSLRARLSIDNRSRPSPRVLRDVFSTCTRARPSTFINFFVDLSSLLNLFVPPPATARVAPKLFIEHPLHRGSVCHFLCIRRRALAHACTGVGERARTRWWTHRASREIRIVHDIVVFRLRRTMGPFPEVKRKLYSPAWARWCC